LDRLSFAPGLFFGSGGAVGRWNGGWVG